MTAKSLKLPKALVEKMMEFYQLTKDNRSKAIRNGLADFLLMPLDEQVVDKNALEKLLTVEEELTCISISVRMPDELLDVVEKLAGGQNLSETITWMLSRVLYRSLEMVNTECTERLLYVLGNKWNSEMQKAIAHIKETAKAEWKVTVETCAGALAIFTNHEFAQDKILNDNDWNKSNLLKVIRDYPRELIVRSRALEVNADTFDILKDCSVTPQKSADVAAAVRFLYLNLNSHMGECDSFDKNASKEKFYKRLEQVHPLHLKLQNVEIHDKDIFDILKKYRKKDEADRTLFIIDPPYLGTSGYEKRLVSKEPSYGLKFGLEQHQKLAKLLHNIKKKDGNDFIYFCRITATRSKDQKTKENKQTAEELAKMDRDLELEIGRLYFGHGYYYLDVNTLSDGTVERIITSFDFDGAIEYGKGRA